MQGSSNWRITTTPSIAGHRIVRHCGPVTAQAVSGAGMVTEFLAGFADVFGGKAPAVRARLQEIHDEVLDLLWQRAARLGANWIVGLRLDSGEISGKGKMMFMVSATGTAVLAEPVEAVADGDVPQSVSREAVEVAIARRRLAAIAVGQLDDPDRFEPLIARQVDAAAPIVLGWLAGKIRRPEASMVTLAQARPQAAAFFAALPVAIAIGHVYTDELQSPGGDEAALMVLCDVGLLDLERTLAALQSGDDARYRWGLATLAASAPSWRSADLEMLDRLAAAIAAHRPAGAEVRSVKKLMGKRRVWICCAGHECAEATERCSCGLDRAGFRADGMTPERAVARMTELRVALSDCFGPGAR